MPTDTDTLPPRKLTESELRIIFRNGRIPFAEAAKRLRWLEQQHEQTQAGKA